MRAFGWADRDYFTDWLDEYDVTIDWDSSKAYVHQRFKTYAVFKRIKPYTFNPLFNLLEIIMSIQSWIRRKLIFLLFGIDLLLFGIGIFYFIGGKGMNEYIYYGLAVLAFVYLPSIAIAFLGFLTRKIFHIDEKLKDNLEANGYMREQDI